MMSTVQITRWRTLESWSPATMQITQAAWPMRPLSEILTEARIDPYHPSADELVKFAGVRWYGQGLFVREERPGSSLQAKCFPLKRGLLIYNRLFAWKSAFAVVPAAMAGVVVSVEFPQFHVNETLAHAEYVRRVCTSASFAVAVASRSTGTTAVSRNRLGQTDFLSMSIPLPPLDVQKSLVADFRSQESEADALTLQATGLREHAWAAFEGALGVAPLAPTPIAPSVYIAKFASLSRWDGVVRASDLALRWPVVPLETQAEVRLGCQVPRRGSRGPGDRHPYLRAANVKRGSLDLSDVKQMRVTDAQARSLRLHEGDLLFVEGSGSFQEVGRCAVWDGRVDGAIHQNSIIRARPSTAEIDPHFAAAWFNSTLGGAYFREQATTTSGLFHIGARKTATAPLPLPPLRTQKELANGLWSALEAAANCDVRAARARRRATDWFAARVYGESSADRHIDD